MCWLKRRKQLKNLNIQRLGFSVFAGEVDKFVARNRTHLAELLEKQYGKIDAKYMLQDEWTPIPLSTQLTIDFDGNKITRTAGEWIVYNGEGLLCSTEY